ncbi:hypothetical protein DM860_004101 [Cuscuta australis]|uniref:RNA-dependent RNA polymerase n=1 Tax=Cuscuta australis TaxID=267555 RepID=A0A328CYP7_9ASTE|nr:hypothetical protein DM860_004101 [Cuscuta australis]
MLERTQEHERTKRGTARVRKAESPELFLSFRSGAQSPDKNPPLIALKQASRGLNGEPILPGCPDERPLFTVTYHASLECYELCCTYFSSNCCFWPSSKLEEQPFFFVNFGFKRLIFVWQIGHDWNAGMEEKGFLSPTVESMVEKICFEQCQEPLDDYAKRALASLGEQASIELLEKVSVCTIRKSLSAFIVFMAKKHQNQPSSSAESVSKSPHRSFSALSPCSSSNSTAGNVPLYKSNVRGSGNQKPRYNDAGWTPDSKNSKPKLLSSPLSPHTFSHHARRSEFKERGNTQGISYQLSALSELEFRKFYLILNYIGRNNLEDVVTPEAADDIADIGDQPMASFESYIWSKYGHLCEDCERLRVMLCSNITLFRLPPLALRPLFFHVPSCLVLSVKFINFLIFVCAQYTDWDSGRTHLYYCNIDSNEECTFKGPYLNAARTHLQQALGDDNVLIVRFLGDAPTNPRKIVEKGISVGLRRYHFFVFKDEGKSRKRNSTEGNGTTIKSYFVRMDTGGNAKQSFILQGKTVHEARCLFMHVHMVSSMAKYVARFSLILSKTVKYPIDLGPLGDVKIYEIEDTYCRVYSYALPYFISLTISHGAPLIQTDGTGYISEDLAKKCPSSFYSVKHLKGTSSKKTINGFQDTEFQNMEPPLLMQCRLYYDGRAVKGTLLVDRRLTDRSIHVRPSMVKVGADPELFRTQTFNSLEIVAVSHKPKRAHLSKTLIALLRYGGVPSDFFLDILKNALEEARNIYCDEILALKAASNLEDLDYGSIAKSMILSGVPLYEPHLQWCLSMVTREEKVGLKGGKLPISDSFYLIGTADPTETLNRDEVCVILDYGQIVGEVLVYRNPGLHFGDIHKLNAVHVKEIDEVVGNAKYGIFFSTKGQRSVASEIANGDFDGDVYWVSRNRELIEKFRASSPWQRMHSTPKPVSRKPNEFSSKELEHELFQMFLETKMPSYSMAAASDSWMAHMDKLLVIGDSYVTEKEAIMEKMLRLIDLYYDALDAPKSGKKVNIPNDLKVDKLPHFMAKERNSYHSTSVLGEIYDTVVAYETKAPPPVEIEKLSCFNIKVPDECLRLWRKRYNEYRADMAEALSSSGESKNDLANEVVKKYKQLLYGTDELEESEMSMREIYDNALAVYHVTYDHAISMSDVRRCSFAWKVAGSALCRLHAELQAKNNNNNNGKAVVVSPSMLQKILHLRV